MEHDDLEFNDPGLRSAVRRAWEGEHAPQRLRARVGRLLATAASVDQPAVEQSAWERWQGRIYGLAAAAVFLLGVGLLVLYYQGVFDPALPGRGGYAMPVLRPTNAPMPITLAQSMVATHTSCGKLPAHELVTDLPTRSFRALSVKLTSDLGFPVMARGVGSDWTFKGAGECVVGSLHGAHLVFVRGEETISVFSLPASCMMGVLPGAQFDGAVQGHQVAGFSRGGAIYAVVASSPTGSVTADMVNTIRDGLFGQFDPATCGEASDLDLEF